jgi:hypothetical protein
MAKRSIQQSKKPQRSSDPNVAAHQVVSEIAARTEEPEATDAEVSRVMAMLGRKGGKIGGASRAKSLSPRRRREIALKAARARWDGDAKQL